jgi:hypothetical protein
MATVAEKKLHETNSFTTFAAGKKQPNILASRTIFTNQFHKPNSQTNGTHH